MYNKNSNFRGSNRGGGNFRNNFRGGNRSARVNPGLKIDVSRFINKASKVSEVKYVSQNTFETFDIHNQLKANILKKGFNQPLPIQDQAIPHILAGKDLIGIANTGMGKTLAFLVPMINKIIKDSSQKVLIITPTRELAQQIDEDLYNLTYKLNIWKVVCVGGTNISGQLYKLRGNHNFVVGTPGRLKDLAERRALNLPAYNNIVIDEVDRMFDMGFANDVRGLIDRTSSQRQALFFSATLDQKVETLIKTYSANPVRISVKTRDTAEGVDQDIIRVRDESDKFEVLGNMLKKEEFKKILIFGRTKHRVHKLAENLRYQGFKAESIHGNKTQSQRQRSLKMFKDGVIDILVATDVAARGLDIPNVSHVINYEVPETYEDYIHRIGRTGRANALGKAFTFIS